MQLYHVILGFPIRSNQKPKFLKSQVMNTEESSVFDLNMDLSHEKILDWQDDEKGCIVVSFFLQFIILPNSMFKNCICSKLKLQ